MIQTHTLVYMFSEIFFSGHKCFYTSVSIWKLLMYKLVLLPYYYTLCNEVLIKTSALCKIKTDMTEKN